MGLIKITTLAEINERIQETFYDSRRETKLLSLETKKYVHIFLKYDEDRFDKVYHIKMTHDGFSNLTPDQMADKSFERSMENLYWEIYDEILEDMNILNQE